MDLVKGWVINNYDPQGIGRLKVRIPHLHGGSPGSSSYMNNDSLPWSYPAMPWYGAYECGSFIVPPIGACLWLAQVEGEDSYWVYLGGSFGTGPKNKKPMGSMDSSSDSFYETPVGIVETPSEIKSTNQGVIFKSPKGHTIFFSDVDGSESFEFIDRSGQSIKFKCPVSKEDNKNNGARRTGSVPVGDSGSIEIESCGCKITMSKSGIILKSPTSTISL